MLKLFLFSAGYFGNLIPMCLNLGSSFIFVAIKGEIKPFDL